MQLSAINETILNSRQSDWARTSKGGLTVCFYKGDVHLRLESSLADEDENSSFNEEWAVQHADPHATRQVHHLYYGQTLLDSITLVGVDGGRALVPLPKFSEKSFDRIDFKVAEILDYGRLHEYVQRCGFSEYGLSDS